jgi:hypothetical protein
VDIHDPKKVTRIMADAKKTESCGALFKRFNTLAIHQ